MTPFRFEPSIRHLVTFSLFAVVPAVMSTYHTDTTRANPLPASNLPYAVTLHITIEHGCPSVPLPSPIGALLNCRTCRIRQFAPRTVSRKHHALAKACPSIAALNSTPRSSRRPLSFLQSTVVVLARGKTRRLVKRDWPRDVSARWAESAAGPIIPLLIAHATHLLAWRP
jgi:hypothetical protein